LVFAFSDQACAEQIRDGLRECEKALTDYLETKRRAFPRFYFVSPTDLLDILSKGNSPTEVMKHMPKLTDNTGKLEFASTLLRLDERSL
jgi:dynein heavy chain